MFLTKGGGGKEEVRIFELLTKGGISCYWIRATSQNLSLALPLPFSE